MRLEQRWISGAADVIAAGGLVADKVAQYMAGFVRLLSMAGQRQRQQRQHQQPHEQQRSPYTQQLKEEQGLSWTCPCLCLRAKEPSAADPKTRAGRRTSVVRRPVQAKPYL